RLLAQLHDGALAELLLDLADREVDRPLAIHVDAHVTPSPRTPDVRYGGTLPRPAASLQRGRRIFSAIVTPQAHDGRSGRRRRPSGGGGSRRAPPRTRSRRRRRERRRRRALSREPPRRAGNARARASDGRERIGPRAQSRAESWRRPPRAPARRARALRP